MKTPKNYTHVIEENLMPAISAQPYEYELPTDSKVALVIIDMQRDFLEHGGFGEALGNDVTQLQSIVPTVKKLSDRLIFQSFIQLKRTHLICPIVLPLSSIVVKAIISRLEIKAQWVES
jgi:hypothetical protein